MEQQPDEKQTNETEAPTAEQEGEKHPVRAETVEEFLKSIVGEDMHAKRIMSLSNAVLGTVHAAALAVHLIGQALAQARGLRAKHAVKQVDRMLSNAAIKPWTFFKRWVPFLVRGQSEIVVALDWTDFAADDHTTIVLSLVTGHGRATPLLWSTTVKSQLGEQRNQCEDDLLARLREVLPAETKKVTVLADRGFGDSKLYGFLEKLGFDYVIRFRGCINVTNARGETRPAMEWVREDGRARLLKGAGVTADECPVAAVVCTQAAGMKDAWCLATSRSDLPASATVKLYGRRFTIEENFRDTKDLRFGMGLASTHVRDPERRDRLLLLSAIASTLISLLGAAGERIGMDRMLKVNTAKKRTHSLLRQGMYYYGAIPNMREDELSQLVEAFGTLLREEPAMAYVLAIK